MKPKDPHQLGREQEDTWAKRYAEVVKQVRFTITLPSDNSSLVQPSPYDDVPTVFTTSAGDQPVTD